MEYEYIKVIETSTLKINELNKFILKNGQEIVIIKLKDEIIVIDNKCPHMGMPLCEGILLDDGYLVCRYHQWKFNLKTGLATFAPNIYLKKYEFKIENDIIYVKMLKY